MILSPKGTVQRAFAQVLAERLPKGVTLEAVRFRRHGIYVEATWRAGPERCAFAEEVKGEGTVDEIVAAIIQRRKQ